MKSTMDIWFAAFLFQQGFEVVKVEKDGRRGSFFFEMDGDAWSAQKMAFGKSADINVKYTHEKLKDLLYQ